MPKEIPNLKKIQIVLATSTPANALRMLNEVSSNLPNHDVSASALYIGQEKNRIDHEVSEAVTCIGISKEYLSIAESRNICQSYLQKILETENAIGLVLDDDLSWVMQEETFSDMCTELQAAKCDMALCALSGDAPIPKEYTRASPLLDVLIDINKNYPENQGISDFLSSISLLHGETPLTGWHHDFYAYKRMDFRACAVNSEEVNWNDFLNRLYLGKTTTRTVTTPTKIIPASGRERGGATIVFNPSILDYKNISFRYAGIDSRRSDMMMATHAKNAGYNTLCTPPILEHERTDTFDSHNPRKLIGDIMGYALIESYSSGSYCSQSFKRSFSQRLKSTVAILEDTCLMLALLHEHLSSLEVLTPSMKKTIKNILFESQKTQMALFDLDKNELFKLNLQYEHLATPATPTPE